MDVNKVEIDALKLSKVDEILATEEELAPSSGFLAAVMERVHEEARMPAPIPFPWNRALPGFVLAVLVFGWAGVELVRLAVPAIQQTSWVAPHFAPGLLHPMEQVGWVMLALATSLASWLLARRLAGRSGLL
jgi:hypothetical protein